MKITIIGAGSTYTPELIEGLIHYREELPLDSLSLMDIDRRKLDIVGGLANRMLEAANMPCAAQLTMDLDEALTGADYVLAQIRVGLLPARVLDETIPLKYGLIGQETTGIGGFFKALRTIPQIKKIADRMAVLCPDAWLINFSNPSGILAELILNHTGIRGAGLCNVPINMTASLREGLALPNAEVEFTGLNHLVWVTSVRDGGREYLPEAIEKGLTGGQMKNVSAEGFDYDVVRTTGAIPCSYQAYYYFRGHKLAEMRKQEKCRGELCVDIEEELLAQYKDAALHIKPPELAQRGGSRYSEAAVSLLSAIHNDKKERHVVNVLNDGAVPFMAKDDVVEIACTVGKNGIVPVPVHSDENPHIRGMMRTVKAYEKLAVQAALTGDDALALNALLLNPLTGDFEAVKPCYYELKQAHRAHLPQFFAE